MRRRAATLIATAMIGVACRQLVGIGDDPPSGASVEACGLPYTGPCASCVTTNCCAQAQACAANKDCAPYATCLANCAGDQACRTQCEIDHSLLTEPQGSNLRACMLASCSGECATGCANLDLVTSPEAAAACAACFENGLCEQDQPIDSDPQRSLWERCVFSCPTPDCRETCGVSVYGDAMPPPLFVDAGPPESGVPAQHDCRRECTVGENWACVGRVKWPRPAVAASDLTSIEASPAGVDAGPPLGLRADLCSTDDCATPLGSTLTNAAGAATFHVPLTGSLGPGIGSYIHIVSPEDDGGPLSIAPVSLYWGFPLSEASHNLGAFFVPRGFIARTLTLLREDASATDRGHLLVAVYDCLGNPALHVRLSSTSGNVYYFDDSFVPTRGNVETLDVGLAAVANAQPGVVSITATPTSLGATSHRYDVVVRAGEVTVVNMVPTP